MEARPPADCRDRSAAVADRARDLGRRHSTARRDLGSQSPLRSVPWRRDRSRYLAFDADNHYYEALDAFTRHVDPAMQPRCVQWCEINGRKYHVVGGIVSHAVTNPTFDPVAKAGAMHDYFRGNPNKLSPTSSSASASRFPAEYRDRDARIAKLDEFGLEAVWLFPTLGHPLRGTAEARHRSGHDVVHARSTAGSTTTGASHYQDQIFASPYITLADLDWADRASSNGRSTTARVHIVMRPAAPHTRDGQVPASDPRNDPFWARVNEAGITVVAHAGDSGYSSNGYAVDGFAAGFSGGGRWAPTSRRSTSSGPRTTSSSRSCSTSSSSGSPTCASRRSRTARSSSRDLFNKLRSTEQQDAGLLRRRSRSSRTGATSG